MRKNKLYLIVLILIIIFSSKIVFAVDNANRSDYENYTKEYKEYLELSEEEKKNVLQPRMYEVPYHKKSYKNPLLKANMLGSNLDPQFSLKDRIGDNIVIKNQENTNTCWAFAALSSLETNLALNDWKNNVSIPKVYDFSERHMEYATSRVFLNNQINPTGYKRQVNDGGAWDFASSYLTNGSGAIDENEMPFENNYKTIDISEIQGKTVTSQVYDTVEFPDYLNILINDNDSNEIKNRIKNHIKNYGSVFTGIIARRKFRRTN